MKLSDRDRRALMLLAAGLAVAAVLYFVFPGDSGAVTVVRSEREPGQCRHSRSSGWSACGRSPQPCPRAKRC